MLRPLAISCVLLAFGFNAGARTRPHYGGTLRVEITGDPWQRGGLASRLVFDGLTTLASDGTLRPALATEWSSENDARRWQFHLRPGVRFHDGSTLSTVAVVASLTMSCAANCPWTAIHALGSSIVITADAPMPNLPGLMASDEFLIQLSSASFGKTPSSAVGTGPFQATGFANGALTLAANDSCWQGRPFVDSVEIRTHRSIPDQWLDLATDRADLVEVPAEDIRRAQQQRLTVSVQPASELLAIQVSDSGALANRNLRAAIPFAIDRGTLANVIFQKQGQAATSLLPQSVSGYAFLFAAERDLNKARELRGGLNPPPLWLAVEGDGALQLAAQRIALNLREAGFNVQVATITGHAPNMILRKLPLAGGDAPGMLETLLRAAGQPQPIAARDFTALYKSESEALDRRTLIPLVDLPRAWASSSRVRDLVLRADGTPDVASASLVAAP